MKTIRKSIFSVKPWLITLAFLVKLVTAASECQFVNYKSSCEITVGQTPIVATVTVNQCHLPVDVTFLIAIANSSTDWQYTFVTTNLAETQTIAGLEEQLSLHVILTETSLNSIKVKADFHLGKIQQKYFFINEEVQLGDCPKDRGDDWVAQNIAIAVIVAFVLSCLIATGLYFYIRHKRNAMDRLALVASNDAGLPGTQPYQEGAAASGSNYNNGCRRKTPKNDLKVEYKRKEDIVIENNFTNP